MPKSFLPTVLTANHLLDGDAVWWTGFSWSRDIESAAIAHDETAAAALKAVADGPGAEAEVVGPYLVEVGLETGAPYPLVRREAIRADREPTFAYAPAQPLDRAA